MILDTSAIVAILTDEPDGTALLTALREADDVRISAATYFETCIVVDGRHNPSLSAKLDDLLADVNAQIEPVTESQARIARQAYRDYGKGSGHRAQLNFGDCFTYALARERREPVLYKGEDFVHTDLYSALNDVD